MEGREKREKERKRERDRQTDRQISKQTNRRKWRDRHPNERSHSHNKSTIYSD